MNLVRRRDGRTPYQRLGARAVCSGSLLAFLIIGIVLVGDFSIQWWLLLLPVLLLLRPALAVRREAGRHPSGDEQTTPWAD